ncbi:MAG: antibiotic biosynthesis monooxygenase family protein [Bacteroidota bacterium]
MPHLRRIVRMTFRPDAVEAFVHLFETAAPHIRAFPGCHHLELWRDAEDATVFTTFSHWTDADALNAYRHSDLFRTTWAKTKPLFAAKPETWSYLPSDPTSA